MSSVKDLAILESLPPVRLWGEDLDTLSEKNRFKGKFVVTADGQFFAKLYPKPEWDQIEFFHDMLVKELGVQDAESLDVKDAVTGGGKIEVERIGNAVECRLYGKSTIYGDYEPALIDKEAVGIEIQEIFDLDDLPVHVIADYEER